MMLDDYDVIILDCDGVLFDSNNLKLNIFKTVLSEYNDDLINEFTNYAKNNFGNSRYHFINYFVNNILKTKDINTYHTILKNYSENCVQMYRVAKLTMGASNFLESYKHKNLYIASGSDELELQCALKYRKLNHFFVDVLGSPRKKTESISKILNKYKTTNALMIGDSKTDFLAAKNNKIDFIYISKYSTAKNEMKQLSTSEQFKTFQNLGELI